MPNKPLKCTLTNVKKNVHIFPCRKFHPPNAKTNQDKIDGRTDEPITIVCPQSAALKIEKVY